MDPHGGDPEDRRLANRVFRSKVLSLALVLSIGFMSLTGPGASAPARAAGALAVNSTAFLGSDATPGDGICATSTGVCTLRAAFEEANALGGNVAITVAAGFSGTISATCVTSTWMVTTALTNTAGAYYAITQPNVTLDLKNSLSVVPTTDCNATALYVNGANALIMNVTNMMSGDEEFLVSGNGDGATFSNITTVQTVNNYLERTIVLQSGADNVTVRASRFSGNYGTGALGEGVVEVVASAAVTNLRLIGNVFTNDLASTACSAVDGRGCRRSGVAAGANAALVGFIVQNNTFDSYSAVGRGAIRFYCQTVSLTGADINGNTFTGTTAAAGTALEASMIGLPCTKPLLGTNYIRNNRFTSAAGVTAGYAIAWTGPVLTANSTTASNLSITDNYFDGFGGSGSTVRLAQAGIVTAQRNTFGLRSAGSTAAASETTTPTFLNNTTNTTNRRINTWYPSAVTVVNATCTITLTLTRPVAPIPTAAATADVYYSSGTDAEQYLGSAAVSGSTGTTIVSLPYTSSIAGFLRVQTQGAPPAVGSQIESSQYSRQLAVGASPVAAGCGPRVTVDQAGFQSDPTSERMVHFTVTTSEALAATGIGSLQAGDFDTSASGVPSAVQVVSVTKINDMLYDVVASSTVSQQIVLSLPAGAVADTGGSVSLASTSTDNSVAYVSPLSRVPALLTVYQGAPGSTYAISRAASLPATADIVVATALSNAWVTAPSSVTLATSVSSASVLVASSDLAGQTRTTTVTHTSVTSTDPNYNGLQLDPVNVTAFPAATLTPAQGPLAGGQAVSLTVAYLPAAVTGVTFGGTTAPFTGSGGALTVTTPARASPTGVNITVDVTITYANGTSVLLPAVYTYVPQGAMTVVKRGYADAAHTQLIANNGDVLTGQTVYWTYTVQNTGETPISSVSVTDAKLPSATYPSGVVCTVPSLAIGASTVCAASAAVTP